MLEKYFQPGRTAVRLMHCGLMSEYMEEYAGFLYENGYSLYTGRGYLRAIAHWSRYAQWCGKTDIQEMNHEFAKDFLDNHLPNCSCERMNTGKYSDTTAAIGHMLDLLSKKGVIEPIRKTSVSSSSYSDILTKYDDYLINFHALSEKTRKLHRKRASIFMDWLIDRNGSLNLSNLDSKAVIDFQKEYNDSEYSLYFKKSITGCLRGFIRFLRWERIIDEDLTKAVYQMIHWKLSDVPKFIPFEDVKKLLQAPDTNTVIGKRDLIMLLFMTYLGMRAHEVVAVRIADINLLDGEITVRASKTSSERKLPLTEEMAEVIVDYLKNRPEICKNEPKLFVRSTAPYTAIQTSSALGEVVRKYIYETGIKTPTYGTHQLRHSLATHLINNGITLKEIADILGHKNLQSTTVYAKVNFMQLEKAALSLPEFKEALWV